MGSEKSSPSCCDIEFHSHRFSLISHMVSFTICDLIWVRESKCLCEFAIVNVLQKTPENWNEKLWKFFLLHQLFKNRARQSEKLNIKRMFIRQLIKLYSTLSSVFICLSQFCVLRTSSWELKIEIFRFWFHVQILLELQVRPDGVPMWKVSVQRPSNENEMKSNKNALKNYHRSHLTIGKHRKNFVIITFFHTFENLRSLDFNLRR